VAEQAVEVAKVKVSAPLSVWAKDPKERCGPICGSSGAGAGIRDKDKAHNVHECIYNVQSKNTILLSDVSILKKGSRARRAGWRMAVGSYPDTWAQVEADDRTAVDIAAFLDVGMAALSVAERWPVAVADQDETENKSDMTA